MCCCRPWPWLIAACRKSLLWAWVAVAASFIVGMLVRAYSVG